MGKKSLWIGAVVAAGVASVVLPLAPVGAAPPAQDTRIINTAADPVPVTGTVGITGTVPVSGTVTIGGTSAPLAVVPSTPGAGHSYGIPLQSLTSGTTYTFIDARYSMKASTITLWTRDLVQFSFPSGTGGEPLLLMTDAPLAVPLPQPFQTGTSVAVTCMSTSGCRFQFSLVGS
jgi:hypothetical protein